MKIKKTIASVVVCALVAVGAFAADKNANASTSSTTISAGVTFPVNYFNTEKSKSDNVSGTGFDFHVKYMENRNVGFNGGVQLGGLSRYYDYASDTYTVDGFGTLLNVMAGLAITPFDFWRINITVTPQLCFGVWFPDQKDSNGITKLNLGVGGDLAVSYKVATKVYIVGGYSFNWYFFRINPQEGETRNCAMLEHLPRIGVSFTF